MLFQGKKTSFQKGDIIHFDLQNQTFSVSRNGKNLVFDRGGKTTDDKIYLSFLEIDNRAFIELVILLGDVTDLRWRPIPISSSSKSFEAY